MERKKSRWSFLSNGYLVLVLLFTWLLGIFERKLKESD